MDQEEISFCLTKELFSSPPRIVAINGSGNLTRLFGVIPQKLYAICGVAFVVFQVRFKYALLKFYYPETVVTHQLTQYTCPQLFNLFHHATCITDNLCFNTSQT